MNPKKLAGVSLCPVVIVLMAVGSAPAFNPQPDPQSAMPIIITDTQTAEVHEEVSGIEPTLFVLPEPILVGLGIHVAQGMLLARMREALQFGHVASLQLSGRDLGLLRGARRTIYGVVQCLGGVAESSLRQNHQRQHGNIGRGQSKNHGGRSGGGFHFVGFRV